MKSRLTVSGGKAPPRGPDRRFGGLIAGRRGTTALEFAIISIPFLLFLLFLFEMGCDFYVQLALDYAVQEGARRLQTGQGSSATSVAQYKTDCICPIISGFLNCNQIALTIYPISTTDYYLNDEAGGGQIPLSGGILNTSSFVFTPGGADTPMFMQAIYTSVSAVGLLLPSMSVSNGTTRVHVTASSVGFLNETFGTSSTICGSKT